MAKVPGTLVGMAWYRREDWNELRRIFTDADILHDTYEKWLYSALKIESTAKRFGHRVERVVIDPATFPDWCRERGLATNAEARTRYATEVAGRKHGEGRKFGDQR
jgi:hypothetical protein